MLEETSNKTFYFIARVVYWWWQTYL